MPFPDPNPGQFKPAGKEALDDKPICFKGRKGQKEALSQVNSWQEKLRDYVDELILRSQAEKRLEDVDAYPKVSDARPNPGDIRFCMSDGDWHWVPIEHATASILPKKPENTWYPGPLSLNDSQYENLVRIVKENESTMNEFLKKAVINYIEKCLLEDDQA